MTLIKPPTDKLRTLVSILILLTLVVFVYGYSLSCGFLADDSCEILSLKSSFDRGGMEVFCRLIAPWQNPEVQLFYRPLVELSFILNFCVGGVTNAASYHLVNMALHFFVAIAVYFLACQLFQPIGQKWQSAALLSAAIFEVNPLGAEVVSWLVGRVDSMSVLFFILTLNIHIFCHRTTPLDAKSRALLRSLALLSAGLALLSKETAFTLPVVIFVYEWFVRNPSLSFMKRFRSSAMGTFPYFLLLILFIISRAFVIGTVFGGYLGSFGETYFLHPFGAALFNGNLNKMFLPYNESALAPESAVVTLLRVCVFAIGILLILRAIFGVIREESRQVWAFLLVCFFLALAFVLPYAFVQNTLAGGRFLYLPSVPLTIVLCGFLLLEPLDAPENSVSQGVLRALSLAMLFCTVIVFTVISYKTGDVWIEAAELVSKFRSEIVRLYLEDKSRGLVLLNAPDNHKGVHLFHNFEMLDCFVRLGTNVPARIYALQQNNRSELINRGLLRRLVDQNHVVCIWDKKRRQLVSVENESSILNANLAQAQNHLLLKLDRTSKQASSRYFDSFELTGLSLRPQLFDFATIKLIGPSLGPGSRAFLSWTTDDPFDNGERKEISVRLNGDSNEHIYTFSLGDLKSWFLASKINGLVLRLPPGVLKTNSVALTLFSGLEQIPQLTPVSDLPQTETTDGVLMLSPNSMLRFDVTNIPSATAALLEVSKPNCSFQHYAGTFREATKTPLSMYRQALTGVNGQIAVYKLPFSGNGLYQIRIFALNSRGKVVGYSSDPVEYSVVDQRK